MVNVGMDVHQTSTVFCLYDPRASEAERYRTLTRSTTAEAFREVLEPLKRRCRVAFEVGCQTQWVAKAVRPFAVELHVANAARIPWLFRDGRKNDRLDAKKLAILLALDQLPEVHLPSPEVSSWRALISYRRRLVQGRTRVKNQIRSILRTFARRCPHRSCWSRVGQAWLRSQIFDAARDLMMKDLHAELRLLQQRLKETEHALDKIAEQHLAVALLRTIPGIGPRTAEAIVAFTDEIKRFRDRKRFASYFGMTPTEDSSGLVRRHGHISKRGPSVVRWVLVEAARQAIRYSPEFAAYCERISKGRRDRRKKAVVATGRKLLVISYGMLRTGEEFDPRRVASSAVRGVA